MNMLPANVWHTLSCCQAPVLQVMLQDLVNIRIAAAFLQLTEFSFDLVSPVDELGSQIKLEFDFEREAKVMDTIADHLKV